MSPKFTLGYSPRVNSIGRSQPHTHPLDGIARLTNMCLFDFNIRGSYVFAIDHEQHTIELVQTVASEKVHEVCAQLPANEYRLDERVLGRIIAYTFYSDTLPLSTFKRLLPLAAVNRTWRRLSLPHIHSTAIIECQSVPTPRKPDPKPKSKVAVWTRPDKTGPLPLTKTTSSTATATTTTLWQTNLSLITSGGKPSPLTTRLCVQAFDAFPDYSSLVDTLCAGFGRHQWPFVRRIEVRDCSGLRRVEPVTAANSNTSSRSNSSSSLSPMAVSRVIKPGPERGGLAKLAGLVSKHAPGVVEVVGEPWECNPNSLAAHLASAYFNQLCVCKAPLIATITRKPDMCANLTVLSIQTSILQSSGSHLIPVDQLCELKLLQAEAFFSWEAFGSSGTLEFSRLVSLTIDFEKDHVANDSHRYDAQKGGKNPRVTMGVDRRRILFPRLTNLCIRKLPYTYAGAWAMFLDAPIKNLALAGKFAHIRYLDMRVLRGLDIFDMHVYLSEKSFGKFSTFVKTVLAVPSTARSAWIRHSEVFPISVPDLCAWTQLRELNVTAYIPTFTLLALVSRLPELQRLIAQRIARDDSEAMLESDAGPLFVEPGMVASRSVCELQLHMGGNKPRVTTLQNIIYVVLCMPCLRRLAVKQAYRKDIRLFFEQRKEVYPELANLEYVHHINMRSIPAQFL